jgi:fumarylpyruvate hydrolase
MGTNPDRDPPFFFMKPADAVTESGSRVTYPPDTSDLHHEIELVIAIGKGGARLSKREIAEHVFGYAVGVDLTRRDLQLAARKAGLPWDFGKGFDQSAPCSPIVPSEGRPIPREGRIWLAVNGKVRQDADLSEMIYTTAEILVAISHSMRLHAGDLVFTGTPQGVGPLNPGDTVEGGVAGVGGITITIGAAEEAQ